MTPEDIAAVCHAANRAYCEATNSDWTQPVWWTLSDTMKACVIDGVNHAIDNPEASAEEMHNNWRSYKTFEGWVYGEVKSESSKTHPCLVSYKELPELERSKDELFLAIVRGLTC